MVNKKQRILNTIKQNNGISITDLTRQLRNIKRCQLRIMLAYLLGAELIIERRVGMAKLYYGK